jgi:hypothetical protein
LDWDDGTRARPRCPPLGTSRLFGLRNELVYHLITPQFFVWFVEWNELIHHHIIPYIYLVSTNMRNVIVDAFLERQTLNKNRGGALCTGADGPRAGAGRSRPGARRGGALCTRADGPRAGAGRSAAWCKARAPAWRPDGPRPGAGRSARTQGRRKIAGGAWISLPRGTPSGRRDPRSCLGSGRST